MTCSGQPTFPKGRFLRYKLRSLNSNRVLTNVKLHYQRLNFSSIRARKNAKAAEDVEYPAYGVTGPGKDMSPNSGDRMLAQNAQLYHFEHKKQQMLAFDGHADSQRRSMSDNESEDGEEGDYTVYECPGLAPVSYLKISCKTQSLDFVFGSCAFNVKLVTSE